MAKEGREKAFLRLGHFLDGVRQETVGDEVGLLLSLGDFAFHSVLQAMNIKNVPFRLMVCTAVCGSDFSMWDDARCSGGGGHANCCGRVLRSTAFNSPLNRTFSIRVTDIYIPRISTNPYNVLILCVAHPRRIGGGHASSHGHQGGRGGHAEDAAGANAEVRFMNSRKRP